MRVFLAGMTAGILTGGLIYGYTGDMQIAFVMGLLAAVLVWAVGGFWVITAGTTTDLDA